LAVLESSTSATRPEFNSDSSRNAGWPLIPGILNHARVRITEIYGIQ
jgi:hypothetical protein